MITRIKRPKSILFLTTCPSFDFIRKDEQFGFCYRSNTCKHQFLSRPRGQFTVKSTRYSRVKNGQIGALDLTYFIVKVDPNQSRWDVVPGFIVLSVVLGFVGGLAARQDDGNSLESACTRTSESAWCRANILRGLWIVRVVLWWSVLIQSGSWI